MFESRSRAAAHTSAYLRVLDELGCSPGAVTQLAELQFPHAGVPEIVNCRSASYVTSGYRRTLHCIRNFASSLTYFARALALANSELRSLAAGECAGDDFWYSSMRNLRIPL